MIVYDGLMMFMERMSQQSIKRALRSYVRAVDSGTLISSLDRNHASPPLPSALTDLEEILGIHEDGTAVKSSAVPRTPTPSVGPPVPVSDRTKAHLASIRQAALIPNSASLMWVCRRLDYTEEENPNHIVMISDSTGRFVGSVFQCDHLIPTTAEYADLVAQGIQANQGRKPPAVFIDASNAPATAALLPSANFAITGLKASASTARMPLCISSSPILGPTDSVPRIS